MPKCPGYKRVLPGVFVQPDVEHVPASRTNSIRSWSAELYCGGRLFFINAQISTVSRLDLQVCQIAALATCAGRMLGAPGLGSIPLPASGDAANAMGGSGGAQTREIAHVDRFGAEFFVESQARRVVPSATLGAPGATPSQVAEKPALS